MACTPIIRNHGYMPPSEDLALVAVGVDTRETVTLASDRRPLAACWTIAVSTTFPVNSATLARWPPRKSEREVLRFHFDATGVVSNIERFGLQDGNVIVLSRRVTDNKARDSTFVRQLLGSFGQ